LKRVGFDASAPAPCPADGLAKALNALLLDPSWDPAPLLPSVVSSEGRGVLRAALLQQGAAAGKPRPGVRRIMAWYALVSYLGLEAWSWKNALGRGLYPSKEVLVTLASRHGLVLVEGGLPSPSYWMLVFEKPEGGRP
jgi:hypothetical protein